jgi:hypothetical protein
MVLVRQFIPGRMAWRSTGTLQLCTPVGSALLTRWSLVRQNQRDVGQISRLAHDESKSKKVEEGSWAAVVPFVTLQPRRFD